MKYFLDTEFIEGFHQPIFGKRRHFIDLISIGIVCEDGREYHAISSEFNPKDADQWVKDNVISKLPKKKVNWNPQGGDSPSILKQAALYKSNKQIADEVYNFCHHKMIRSLQDKVHPATNLYYYDDPEFYGYYSDYDWVLFCSLFGRMIDLPKGYPMYCRDLKQSLDEAAENITQAEMTKYLCEDVEGKWKINGPIGKDILDLSSLSFKQKLELVKAHKHFPKQENEHNALNDAKWNKKLYDFLNQFKP